MRTTQKWFYVDLIVIKIAFPLQCGKIDILAAEVLCKITWQIIFFIQIKPVFYFECLENIDFFFLHLEFEEIRATN